MKFEQNKDTGECDIIFSKQEIDIINKKGKIILTAEGLRHFGNNLVKIVAEWNLNFNKELQKKQSFSNTVKPKKDV
tara:strand:+ start:1810 stop:2037 length:228 start_codon:yes stop_codon:yes gene_type:complete